MIIGRRHITDCTLYFSNCFWWPGYHDWNRQHIFWHNKWFRVLLRMWFQMQCRPFSCLALTSSQQHSVQMDVMSCPTKSLTFHSLKYVYRISSANLSFAVGNIQNSINLSATGQEWRATSNLIYFGRDRTLLFVQRGISMREWFRFRFQSWPESADRLFDDRR